MEQRIYNIDAFDLLSQIEDDSIDGILTDPPYFGVVDQWWDTQWQTKDDYYQWLNKLHKEVFRVLKPNGFACLFNAHKNKDFILRDFVMINNDCHYVEWRKPKVWHRLEVVYLFKKNATIVDFPVSPLVIAPARNHRFRHPCEKPSKLIDFLLEQISKPKDLILDLFVGSGVVIESCIFHDRRYLGSEIDRDWYHIANQRIESAKLTPRRNKNIY